MRLNHLFWILLVSLIAIPTGVYALSGSYGVSADESVGIQGWNTPNTFIDPYVGGFWDPLGGYEDPYGGYWDPFGGYTTPEGRYIEHPPMTRDQMRTHVANHGVTGSNPVTDAEGMKRNPEDYPVAPVIGYKANGDPIYVGPDGRYTDQTPSGYRSAPSIAPSGNREGVIFTEPIDPEDTPYEFPEEQAVPADTSVNTDSGKGTTSSGTGTAQGSSRSSSSSSSSSGSGHGTTSTGTGTAQGSSGSSSSSSSSSVSGGSPSSGSSGSKGPFGGDDVSDVPDVSTNDQSAPQNPCACPPGEDECLASSMCADASTVGSGQ